MKNFKKILGAPARFADESDGFVSIDPENTGEYSVLYFKRQEWYTTRETSRDYIDVFRDSKLTGPYVRRPGKKDLGVVNKAPLLSNWVTSMIVPVTRYFSENDVPKSFELVTVSHNKLTNRESGLLEKAVGKDDLIIGDRKILLRGNQRISLQLPITGRKVGLGYNLPDFREIDHIGDIEDKLVL